MHVNLIKMEDALEEIMDGELRRIARLGRVVTRDINEIPKRELDGQLKVVLKKEVYQGSSGCKDF